MVVSAIDYRRHAAQSSPLWWEGPEVPIEESLPVRLVAMNHELRIRIAAEFVKVHAKALSIRIYAQRQHAIHQPENEINQRQHQSQQRRNSNKLCSKLALLRCENPSRGKPPQSRGSMNADGP